MKSASTRLDVLVFGEALIDFFAEPVTAALWQATQFRPHLGGAPANLAVGLARQGLSTGLMTLVGRDPFGRMVRERLTASGVDVAAVGEHPTARTGVTFVSVGNRGERSFVFYRHPSADLCITADEVLPQVICRAHVLSVGSSTLSREPARSATWKAIELMRASGRRVSCDLNLRRHLWPEPEVISNETRRLVSGCWLVKISQEELPLLGVTSPEQGAELILELGAEMAVVTMGSKGCLWADRSQQGKIAGMKVDVVDTTGAGDAFMAGLLASLLQGEGLDQACERGNRLGAEACTRVGAT